MTRMTRWISRLLALILMLGTAGYIYLGGQPDRPAQEQTAEQPAPLVSTQTITTQSYAAPITVAGFTRPNSEDILVFKDGGIVEKVFVEKGDSVTQGTPLAQLDTTLQQAEYDQVNAKLTLAQDRVERLETLAQSGAATQTSLDEAQAALIEAQSALTRAQDDLDNRTLNAPFEGRVNDVWLDEGVRINPGQDAIHLIDDSIIYVDAYLSRQEYDTLDQSAKATIDTDHQATLSFLSDTATENRTFRAEFMLEPETTVPLNSRVSVRTWQNAKPAAALELNTIIIDAEGRTGVMALDDNTAVFIPVTILSSGTKTWVSGIPDNSAVITSGQNSVSEGQEVRQQ